MNSWSLFGNYKKLYFKHGLRYILKCNIFDMNITLQDLCGNSNNSSMDDLISILFILFISECADIIVQKYWQLKKCPFLIDKSSINFKSSFC